MRDERFEVSVTFDERHGTRQRAELRSAVVALSLGGLRKRIESRCCPMMSMWCCSSMVSPSANATAAGRRRSWRAEPSIRDVYS